MKISKNLISLCCLITFSFGQSILPGESAEYYQPSAESPISNNMNHRVNGAIRGLNSYWEGQRTEVNNQENARVDAFNKLSFADKLKNITLFRDSRGITEDRNSQLTTENNTNGNLNRSVSLWEALTGKASDASKQRRIDPNYSSKFNTRNNAEISLETLARNFFPGDPTQTKEFHDDNKNFLDKVNNRVFDPQSILPPGQKNLPPTITYSVLNELTIKDQNGLFISSLSDFKAAAKKYLGTSETQSILNQVVKDQAARLGLTIKNSIFGTPTIVGTPEAQNLFETLIINAKKQALADALQEAHAKGKN